MNPVKSPIFTKCICISNPFKEILKCDLNKSEV